MTGFRCGICGQEHDELPMDIGFRRPGRYFTIPEEERDTRVSCTHDLCEIDGRHFLIRGVLELPVADLSEGFRWGPWAEVSEADFRRYVELWDADGVEAEPPFQGRLSGEIDAYPGSDGLPVTVHLHSGGQRPSFAVVSAEHPLGADQRAGITLARVHEFVAPYLDS